MIVVQAQVPAVLERVKTLVAADSEAVAMGLVVEEDDYRIDEEWLYICVYPTAVGIRPSEYSRILGRIEKTLRSEGYDQIGLLPSLRDY